MNKTTILFFRISIILVTSLFLFNCTSESNDSNVIIDKLNSQSNELKTVPLENSLNFLKKLNNDRLTKKSLLSDDIGLKIDIESLEQVDITNTDAKINIASASTKFEGVETQFLQIEINGELQTILFHYVPEKKTTMNSRVPINDKDFTGDVYSTDLEGRVLSGFSINKGTVSGSYNPSPYAIDPVKLNEVIIINPYKAPIIGNNDAYTRMNYQFVRSQNNGSSMGLAYASYYAHLRAQMQTDRIKTKGLTACQEKIIEKLKTNKYNSITKIFRDFGNNGALFTLNIVTGDSDSPAYTQRTKGSDGATISKYDYTITISNSYEKRNSLSLANNILHEIVHAYFMSLYDMSATSVSSPPFVDYGTLLAAYNGNKKLPNENDQHQQMADSFIIGIAATLQEFQTGVVNAADIGQAYTDLAWGGLKNTPAFDKQFDANSTDRSRILNRDACEQENRDVAQYGGERQFPLGKDCSAFLK